MMNKKFEISRQAFERLLDKLDGTEYASILRDDLSAISEGMNTRASTVTPQEARSALGAVDSNYEYCGDGNFSLTLMSIDYETIRRLLEERAGA